MRASSPLGNSTSRSRTTTVSRRDEFVFVAISTTSSRIWLLPELFGPTIKVRAGGEATVPSLKVIVLRRNWYPSDIGCPDCLHECCGSISSAGYQFQCITKVSGSGFQADVVVWKRRKTVENVNRCLCQRVSCRTMVSLNRSENLARFPTRWLVRASG